MTLSQNDMGRAFEYGVACGIAKGLPAELKENNQLIKAKECFGRCSDKEQQKIVKSASEVVVFLSAHDKRLVENICTVSLQSDEVGQQGDVRDIIIHNPTLNAEIGLSAKNRHFAVKHSRLSEQIDFGFTWFGVHCSSNYFNTVTPIFHELRNRQHKGEKWRNISDKKDRYYLPILHAFQVEMAILLANNQQQVARGLIEYLIGKFDYYKIIKENGTVSVLSFNLAGTLEWGRRLPLPSRIIEVSPKPNSKTTLLMTFDQGWQISFRIHNASTLVEPSLKFDIHPVGFPSQMSRYEIHYNETSE